MFGKKREKMSLPRGLASVLGQLLRSQRHIAVIGSTGAGKTTFTRILLSFAEHMGFRTVIIDWHGEYTSIPSLAYPLKVEPKLLPEILSHLVEEESRTPGYSTYLALEKAIREIHDFEDDLVAVLLKQAEVSYSLRLGAQAAAARLAAVKNLITLDEEVEPQRGSHRLDLSRLSYVAAKTLAALYTYQLYSLLKKGKRIEKTLIVLEESQNYSRPTKFLRELRHSGVKVVEIIQYLPEEQANQILANTNLAIGSCGAYSAQLVARYHLPPTITELEDGEFMVFINNKTHRVRLF